MIWIFFIALTLITIAGGLVPIYLNIKQSWSPYLLAFSGALLLAITFLHLLPECFENAATPNGIFILIGFFLQLFLQKFSHGLEHGHAHIHEHTQDFNLLRPIIVGLSVHAFLEGIPLGYSFAQADTMPALFLGVAAHKAPEALTLMSVVIASPISKSKKIYVLLQFALLTPIAGILAYYYGRQFAFISNLLNYLVPIVIGAFIQIATTILFESGAKHHELHTKKIIAIVFGIAVSLLTLLH
jgi:zinc and cadmium transporter